MVALLLAQKAQQRCTFVALVVFIHQHEKVVVSAHTKQDALIRGLVAVARGEGVTDSE